MYKIKTPVLIISFNRPDATAELIDLLREFKPEKIYFAVDGARSKVISESKTVANVRELSKLIDWKCNVFTKFESSNLGCKIGVSSAVSWVLSREDRVIVLEDDIRPTVDFFKFCDELLELYEPNENILAISGHTFYHNADESGPSYRFSGIPHVWGWATWRRGWNLYSPEIPEWNKILGILEIKKFYKCTWIQAVALGIIFSRVVNSKLDSWAYPFVYLAMKKKLLVATSNINLTENIGFGNEATHTTVRPKFLLPVSKLPFPLIHPHLSRDLKADQWTLGNAFGVDRISLGQSIRRRILIKAGVQN